MAHGVTLTVAPGKISSPQTNANWLVTTANLPTAAIDGGASSILNGGGNLRAYTDDTKTTQLAIEILTFVTGGTPDVVVYGLSSTLDVGSTVYIEADEVATTQPSVTDTYGRNAVWTDWRFVSHTLEFDSTGNFTGSFTPTGSPSQVDGAYGNTNGAYEFDGTNQINVDTLGTNPLEGTSSTDEFTVVQWLSSSSSDTFNRGIQYVSNFSNRNLQIGQNADGTNYFVRTSNTNTGTKGRLQARSASDVFELVTATGTMTETPDSKAVRVNGVSSNTNGTSNLGGGTSGSTDITFGARNDGVGDYFGRIAEAWLRMDTLSDDYLEMLENNLTDPASFWTTGSWEDPDGGGSVSGDVSITIVKPEFNSSGSATLPSPNGSIDFALINPLFDGSGEATLPQPSGIVSFDVLVPVFDSTGSATLPQPTGNIDLSINKPVFSASGGATLPYPQGDIDFTVVKPVFLATGSSTQPNPNGAVNFTVSKPEFSGDGSATFPNPSGNIDFDVSKPVFSASGSSTLPYPVGNVDLLISNPVFSLSGSVTLPNPEGNIDLTIINPEFSIYGSVSGIDLSIVNILSVDTGSNIIKPVYTSNTIKLPYTSNVIKI